MNEKSQTKDKVLKVFELDSQKKPLSKIIEVNENPSNPSEINWPTRKKIFSLLLYVVIFTNFDTGVIPACVNQIEAEMSIGSIEIAALGSIPFFAISIASLLVSTIIKRYKSKKTLIFALIMNIIVCIGFSLSYNLFLLYVTRFLMGFTQAFWVIYAPVWTNHSSPVKYQSTWLGTLQGFSPLGIILGYICTGVVIENWAATYAWRLVIMIQAVCEVPILIIMFFIENKELDIMETENEENLPIEGSINPDTSNQIIKHFKVLIKNPIYVCTCLCCTVAFFVVYGIQFWSTTYIIEIFQIDGTNAMVIYGCLSITSPVAGVFFGGYLNDKIGGYKGDNLINSLKLCMAFSIVSVFVGIPSCFVYEVYFWAPLIWAQIFFGACNIPGATGIVVNSVSKEYQTSASGLAQMIYNMLAYFASPLFSGAVMDLFTDTTTGILWGYRANEFVSFLAIIFCGLSMYFCHKENSEKKMNKTNQKEPEKQIKSEKKSLSTYSNTYRQRAWSII